jgi:chromosome partitioning protein
MRAIAILNQKGGCGKTTTSVNLASALATDGFRVLLVDLDPQSHATLALGLDPDHERANLYDVLTAPEGNGDLAAIIVAVSENLDIAPSGIILSALEQKLASERHDSRTLRLAAALDSLSPRYDFVFFDCPPNTGLLTFSALRAATEVIIPLETSAFALDGARRLLQTIEILSERIGHRPNVRVLPSLYDGRTRFARKTLGLIREKYKDLCFDTVIRVNVKLREAAGRGLPIGRYAPRSNGAYDFAALAIEVEAALRGETQEPGTTIPDRGMPTGQPSVTSSYSTATN